MNKDDFPHVLNRTIVNVARKYEIDRAELAYHLLVAVCAQFKQNEEGLACALDIVKKIFTRIQECDPILEERISLKPQKIDN
jgi:hypothetical protein